MLQQKETSSRKACEQKAALALIRYAGGTLAVGRPVKVGGQSRWDRPVKVGGQSGPPSNGIYCYLERGDRVAHAIPFSDISDVTLHIAGLRSCSFSRHPP